MYQAERWILTAAVGGRHTWHSAAHQHRWWVMEGGISWLTDDILLKMTRGRILCGDIIILMMYSEKWLRRLKSLGYNPIQSQWALTCWPQVTEKWVMSGNHMPHSGEEWKHEAGREWAAKHHVLSWPYLWALEAGSGGENNTKKQRRWCRRWWWWPVVFILFYLTVWCRWKWWLVVIRWKRRLMRHVYCCCSLCRNYWWCWPVWSGGRCDLDGVIMLKNGRRCWWSDGNMSIGDDCRDENTGEKKKKSWQKIRCATRASIANGADQTEE